MTKLEKLKKDFIGVEKEIKETESNLKKFGLNRFSDILAKISVT